MLSIYRRLFQPRFVNNEEMKILYCIIHFQNLKVTKRCLDSLKIDDYSNVLLINMPDSITSAHKISLQSNSHFSYFHSPKIINTYPRINVLSPPRNSGYAYACNLGITFMKKNKYDYILLCNNDITFSKNFYHDVHTYLYSHKENIAGFTIFDKKGKMWFNGGEIDPVRWSGGHVKGKTDFVSGCCMLISKKVINAVGRFDESYFMYYEDVDYCYRAHQKRFTINILPLSITHHVLKDAKKNKNMEYYLARNRIRFMIKFASKRTILRELIRVPKTVYEYLHNKNYFGLRGFIKGIILTSHYSNNLKYVYNHD